MGEKVSTSFVDKAPDEAVQSLSGSGVLGVIKSQICPSIDELQRSVHGQNVSCSVHKFFFDDCFLERLF